MKKKQGKTTENLPETTQERTKALTAPKGIAIEDLIEYRKKGLSSSEIGQIVGCSSQNVLARLAEAELSSLDNFRTNKDHTFEHLQRRTLKNIGDDEIKRLNPLQRVTAAAILQDKIQVIRGLSSEIVDHRVLTLDLNKAIEQLRQEQGSSTNGQNEQIIDLSPGCPTFKPSE